MEMLTGWENEKARRIASGETVGFISELLTQIDA